MLLGLGLMLLVRVGWSASDACCLGLTRLGFWLCFPGSLGGFPARLFCGFGAIWMCSRFWFLGGFACG